MTLTITQARDEALEIVKDALATSTPVVSEVVYTDTPDDVPTTKVFWARVTMRHQEAEVTSLSGGIGQQRYTRTGNVFVQLFAPDGEGQEDMDAVAQHLLDALEGKTTAGGMIFRAVRYNEVGSDGPWFQGNVSAEFEYDQVK